METPRVTTSFRLHVDLVESVTEKRTKSRAALVEDVKKQYLMQIDEAKKNNEILGKQFDSQCKMISSMQTEQSEQRQLFDRSRVEWEKERAQLQNTLNVVASENRRLQANLAKANKVTPYRNFVVILVALIIGILVAWLF